MQRRDFLAMCAAAVGCAAVPVKAAMKPNGGWGIHCQDATWAKSVWHLMQYDGEKWVDMGPADLLGLEPPSPGLSPLRSRLRLRCRELASNPCKLSNTPSRSSAS